jgi:hypothetical protein
MFVLPSKNGNMILSNEDALRLFQLRKIPAENITVDFPLHGDTMEIELKSNDGHYKFQADINRKFPYNAEKITYQLRYNKVFNIRRLDFSGGHENPPGPAPISSLIKYEGMKFVNKSHMHIYIEQWGTKWAIPLEDIAELKIFLSDDLYERMEKFFKYCNIESYNVTKVLMF